MIKLRTLLVGAFLALAVASPAIFAWAQPVTQNNISGNECWNAGQGPGGPSSFLCINLVRNGSGMRIISGAGAVVSTTSNADGTLMWSGTAPTTWAITLPTPAFDGQMVTIATDTTLTTLVTVTAPAGQTLNGTFNSQTISANGSVEFRFNFATLKWFRTQ
jgi:hypothetical protein